MHEHHSVERLIKVMLEKAKANRASKITAVTFALGTHSGFQEGSIRVCFELTAKGTIAQGAVLKFKRVASETDLYVEDIEAEA
jgi:Zn finger protein HypA/HybF involved in hydrogenase expression